MITINLHDYKQELQKVAIQKLAVKAAGIVIAAIFLIIVYWGYQQIGLGHTKTEIEKLEVLVNALSVQVRTVEKMKKRARRAAEITKEIERLRSGQFQVTQVLEDLVLSVPDEIWLTNVQQITMKELFKRKVPVIFIGNPDELDPKKKKKKRRRTKERGPTQFIEVKGRVFGQYGDQVLTRYLDGLRKVSYFKEVFLHRTEYQLAGTFPVRDFAFYIYMPVKEKSGNKK